MPGVDVLINFGVLGVILVLILAGWLFTKPHVDMLVKSNER